jgi:hypothetical protein
LNRTISPTELEPKEQDSSDQGIVTPKFQETPTRVDESNLTFLSEINRGQLLSPEPSDNRSIEEQQQLLKFNQSSGSIQSLHSSLESRESDFEISNTLQPERTPDLDEPEWHERS